METLPLFVYGTLMSEQSAFDLLAAASTRYVRAHLPNAQLYSVGPYPIACDGSGEVQGEVQGEIHWLTAQEPAIVLKQLDEYEGEEYRRVQRRAVSETGDEIGVWVYLGDRAYVSQHQPIPAGDWRKRVC